MALSVVDLYRDILPKTNCKACDYPTCLAFASMVVSEKHPIENCPHLDSETLARCKKELEEQYAEGKWLKRDMAQDALLWAREKAASMKPEDLPGRIGGRLTTENGRHVLNLPYFDTEVIISEKDIERIDGVELERYEKVFLYIHMAQGGSKPPTGNWKGFIEFPNTVSKVKSMRDSVEEPLLKHFSGKPDKLAEAGIRIGAADISGDEPSTDVALLFNALPRVPVKLVFWDRDDTEGIDAEIRLLFDETVTDHLDIESIMFLSETIKERLCA